MSDWYYAADNEQKGPINESELKANLASNKLPGDTLVWKDGMDNWTPANQLPAFSFRAAPEPAKVQPGSATTPASTVTSAGPDVDNPESTKPVNFTNMLGTPESLEVSAEDADQHRIFGILSYISIFCLVAVIVMKDSPYTKYHANQGLVLFLCEVAVFMVTAALVFLPILGMLIYFIHILFLFVFLGLAIMGIINAAAGKCVPLPVIGGIKLLK